MSVYIVAQLSFTNREAYDRYQARFMEVFDRFDGQLLAADDHPEVLEGRWDRDKLVVMSFPSEAAARRFIDASEYQEISKDRREGADTVALLVTGASAGT